MTDIVERLRALSDTNAVGDRSLAHSAADEIERLRAERDEAVATLDRYRAENGCTRGQRTTQWCAEASSLRVERDMWRAENLKKQAACEQMGARIVALEAEREAARREGIEAAAKVAEWAHMVPPDGGSPTDAEYEIAKTAAQRIRALLTEGGDDNAA